MTRLRKMMLEELQRRNFAESTTEAYIRAVKEFSQYFNSSPDHLGPRHIREYQASLFQKRKFSPNTVAQHLAALRFFYIKTLKKAWSITETPYPKRAVRLPTILSQEEVTRLIDAAHPPLHALDEQQQKVAIVDPNAYADILTAASRKTALQGQASGLSASKMNSNQFDALMALIKEYAHNLSEELAEGRREQINKAGRNIYFAGSGGISRSDPHYYRVQTPSFLIELDDTRDDANHIHSVWRDFSGDFGQDLLQHHYQVSHPKK